MKAADVHKLVQAELVPLLRTKGFKGSYPHLKRTYNECMHYVSFYAHPYGEDFYCEYALFPMWAKPEWYFRSLKAFEKTDTTACHEPFRREYPESFARINPQDFKLGLDNNTELINKLQRGMRTGLEWLEDLSDAKAIVRFTAQYLNQTRALRALYIAIFANLETGNLDLANRLLIDMETMIQTRKHPFAEFIQAWPKQINNHISTQENHL